MRRLVAGLALSLTAAAAPAAVATSHLTTGTCSLYAHDDPTPGGQIGGPDIFNGTMSVAALVTDWFGAPTSGTVQCSIQVNGVSFAVASYTGFGVVAGSSLVAYVAEEADIVEVCTDFFPDNGPWSRSCELVTSMSDVPPEAGQVVDDIVQDLQNVDPNGCSTVSGIEACASFTPSGTVAEEFVVDGPDSAATRVAGWIDRYTFTLPNGGEVTLPCVVLVTGTTTNDPCADADGVFDGRLLTLLDQSPSLPVPGSTGPPIAVVCDANLVLTVEGIGVNSFPAYTVCPVA
jgi:hypothetical protein